MMDKEYLKATSVGELQQQLNDMITKRKQVRDNLAFAEERFKVLENNYLNKQSGFFNKLFTKKDTVENIGIELEDYRAQVSLLKEELSFLRIDVDGLHQDITLTAFNEIIVHFGLVCSSNKIWNITTVTSNAGTKSSASNNVVREEVKLDVADVEFIQSSFRPLFFQNKNGADLFIYPRFILQSTANIITIHGLKDVLFNFRQQRFIEPKETIPADSKIIDYAWEKINKDGTPDMRFKGNFQTPVVRYGLFEFSNNKGLDTSYYISNYESAAQFAPLFISVYKPSGITATGNDSPIPIENNADIFSFAYYNLLVNFSADMRQGVQKLLNDTVIINNLSGKTGDSSIAEFMAICVIYDLCQVVKLLNSTNYAKERLETTGLMLIAAPLLPGRETNAIDNDYETIEAAYSAGIYHDVTQTVINIGNNANPLSIQVWEKDFKRVLCIPPLLKLLKHDLGDEYAGLLYRFANIVAKADGHISKIEEKKLKEIYQLVHEPLPESIYTNPSAETTEPLPVAYPTDSIEDILAELDSLTGLTGVKQEIKTLINFIKVQKARTASGLKSSPISYHIVFTGNPGTGKTTVARIVAKIYKALGILSKGHLIETDRSGLIAEYVGQTAIKVNKIVDSALDGVLFIDEAYAVAGESQNDFGKEAVATLIKRMEDERHRLVVVIAGYTQEMKMFIDTNPGVQSRFNRYIEFEDYSASELLTMFENSCKKMDYKLTEAAIEKLRLTFEMAYAARNKSFGNGRYVRNVFEKSLEAQANRIASIAVLDKEILTTITEEDIV
ncbi:MAG: AAA family ATPase [Chitinophagaceae bacterium]|nr:AAA family ATPase [Chitinophagaceae bacterium]